MSASADLDLKRRKRVRGVDLAKMTIEWYGFGISFERYDYESTVSCWWCELATLEHTNGFKQIQTDGNFPSGWCLLL